LRNFHKPVGLDYIIFIILSADHQRSGRAYSDHGFYRAAWNADAV